MNTAGAILLSTIGSRGDVQPIAALALSLKELGTDVRVCAPPDFRDWLESLDIPFIPLGPEVRGTAKARPTAKPTPEQMLQIAAATVAAQFAVLPDAAEGCAALVGGGALQIALRSVAELRGIPYVYAAYCPVTLPSAHHAPPAWRGDAGNDGTPEDLWTADARRWNASWGVALNAQRASAGLPPVADVRGHIFTGAPWLAADPALAPWPGGGDVVQTGAWILPDERPLPPELERFLAAGDPPVYFGFGSVRAPDGLAAAMVAAARAHGRRAVVLRGWTDLASPDDGPDCLSLGEVNQQALFRRVAAVVHHGGAGTTTAAARAGTPQVVVPQHYDQHYFARRVEDLGIGVTATPDDLTEALAHALTRAPQAAAFARNVRTNGAQSAARRLLTLTGR
ncbi:Desosaminyl transferase EryCIII precursor [Actinomadura rubteroloni]|uniref:Desosaminyl transferase EryCIII n=1 Tax=Actinomadura rubteroloni TaxID=1926885 RepID=A0A2P4UPS6_9ACTN|nr:glycosyltransferase [Actinomadura rubteroloni]POM27056.1 Desosaminyl transferase EryCIII precursor [Actinomadura rubteroloni]